MGDPKCPECKAAYNQNWVDLDDDVEYIVFECGTRQFQESGEVSYIGKLCLRRQLATAQSRIRRGEQLVYRATEWMLDHGGGGHPLRVELKAWRQGDDNE